MDSLFSLKNKVIWIIGGAGYLGQPIVKFLSENGAIVVCADISDRASLYIQKEKLENVIAADIDTSSEYAIKQFVHKYLKKAGIPFGLVNMSYASTAKKMEDLTGEDFNDVNNNITATFLLSREVGSIMAENGGGSIIHFGSMYGIVSPNEEVYQGLGMNKNPVEYGTNKAAILQMTRYMAVHWGPQNVRCNCISPGPFPNQAVQKQNPEFIKRLSQKVPMARVGDHGEIVGAVVFLLSKAASFITGQNICIDGGWTIW